jgi:hypothetical protein
MISLWLVLWIILMIENMIGSAWTVYTLIWATTSYTLVFFSLICWVLIWYWLKWLFTYDNDNDINDNEKF